MLTIFPLTLLKPRCNNFLEKSERGTYNWTLKTIIYIILKIYHSSWSVENVTLKTTS